jgi:hypothetical protein
MSKRRKSPDAVRLGSKGGKARAKKLTPEQRRAIAAKGGRAKAAAARAKGKGKG